ncbi:RNase H-like domain found in reverse transcriptase [Popillia japonica]|uniref:RNase H-like domain found in reverse transcriptase n=1 Tax=Popillia japonica TaxID=7064 RepID=A0AAW1L9L5_POPJA
MYPITNLLKDKKEVQSDKFLAYYDANLPLVLAVVASPYGVGALLSRIYPNGEEKPLHYASQTPSPTQQRYSQVDREAYAIIFGIKRFYQYVYRRKFTLTDSKPVTHIFNPKKDAMSRLPVTTKSDYTMEEADVIQLNLIEQLPVTSKELGDATGRDDTVKMSIQALKNGRTVKLNFNLESSNMNLPFKEIV